MRISPTAGTPSSTSSTRWGARFALEVPSEIAYDYWTAKRTLEAIGHREGFGLNFDPSHFVWQDLDPVGFLADFRDRIYHVHVKESVTALDGRNGRLGSHRRGGVPMFFVKRWEYFSSLLLAWVFGRGVSTGFQGTTADVGVLSGRFSRGRFVKHSVPQHREQDIAAATGEGDKGLVVPFALRPFTVVVVP